MGHGLQQKAYPESEYTERTEAGRGFPLGKQAIVFQVEVFIILQVTTKEEVRNGHGKKIGDYRFKAIPRPREASALVQECRDVLEELVRSKVVKLK